ncbi:MAG: crossover junction endodeoxyribonuclease RuvC, partial [Spirochaetota bacterium]
MAIIMGIDPGLAHCGWGVLKQPEAPAANAAGALRLCACGEIKTPASAPLHERLAKNYKEMETVFTSYRPQARA